MLFKRLFLYYICFSVAYFPVYRVQAALPMAGYVVVEVLKSTAITTGGYILLDTVVGKTPWASNDPVYPRRDKIPQKNFMDKVGNMKSHLSFAFAFAALGYSFFDNKIYKGVKWRCSTGQVNQYKNVNECIAAIQLQYPSVSHEMQVLSKSMGFSSIDGDYISYSIGIIRDDETTRAYGSFNAYVEEPIPEEEPFNDFWGTSPDVPEDWWYPPESPQDPQPKYPDPEWFPEKEVNPVGPPVSPSPDRYPEDLPPDHPDKRLPGVEPPPVTYPGSNPGETPTTVPDDFPVTWPRPGDVPITNPNPDTGGGENPDGGGSTNPGFPIPLPVIGPLTRAELEQVNATRDAAAADGLASAQPTLDDVQAKLEQAQTDFINEIKQIEPELINFSPFGWFDFGSGACPTPTITVSVNGKSQTLTVDSHCDFYNSSLRPTLEWVLYISTGMYIYLLVNRTIRSI